MISQAEASAELWRKAWDRVTLGRAFGDSIYMTDHHVWFALTLTYISSLDPIVADNYGDQFYKVLKRGLLGPRCDRPSNRWLCPFVLGFREKGMSEGWHHHFVLSVHPTLHDKMTNRFGATGALRELFPVVKSSCLKRCFDPSLDDDTAGWVGYASNGKQNLDGIIFRQPIPACHSKRITRTRRVEPAIHEART